MFGRVKLDNTLLTCDQGNLNQITAWSLNQTLVTVVRDTCTVTVPSTPQLICLMCSTELWIYVGSWQRTKQVVLITKEPKDLDDVLQHL